MKVCIYSAPWGTFFGRYVRYKRLYYYSSFEYKKSDLNVCSFQICSTGKIRIHNLPQRPECNRSCSRYFGHCLTCKFYLTQKIPQTLRDGRKTFFICSLKRSHKVTNYNVKGTRCLGSVELVFE